MSLIRAKLPHGLDVRDELENNRKKGMGSGIVDVI